MMAETLYRRMDKGKKMVDAFLPDPVKQNYWPRKTGQFKDLTQSDFFRIMRIFVWDNLPTSPSDQKNHKTADGNRILFDVLKTAFGPQTEEIENEIQEKAAARMTKLEAKIKALSKKKEPGKQLELEDQIAT